MSEYFHIYTGSSVPTNIVETSLFSWSSSTIAKDLVAVTPTVGQEASCHVSTTSSGVTTGSGRMLGSQLSGH